MFIHNQMDAIPFLNLPRDHFWCSWGSFRGREHFGDVINGRLRHPTFAILFSGHRLDTLARVPLWEAGLDYLHGTGHGIGCYLNVHEGTFFFVYVSTFSNKALSVLYSKIVI